MKIDGRNPKYFERILSHWNFPHSNSNMNCLRTELGASGLEMKD
jgi:hypothetical protein